MALYLYRARNLQGALITGEADAIAADEIKVKLAEQGLIPIAVSPGAAKFRFPKFSFRRVRAEEIVVFTRQFHTLFKAGLSMDSIFSALIRQCQNRSFREVLQQIRSEVSSGGTLARAFSRHPKVFRDLYVHMLAAGEEAGILDETLTHLSTLLEKEAEIDASVKSATLYPKIVLFVLVGAIAVLLTFVVPKFAAFYSHFNAALPLPTRILISLSQSISRFWYIAAGLAGSLFYLFHRYRQTARGRLALGRLSFHLPVFGPLNLRVANARFCHILSALYRSGLPITRSLEITGGTLENEAFKRDVEIVRRELTQGRSLSEAMNRCQFFTPVIQEAVAAGEKAGSLDQMLESVGGHYDMEVGHTIKNLTTLLEPILLVVIFGAVGLFALAIFLPIWNMSGLVTGGG